MALGVAASDGERVLDLGCGSGHTTVELAARTGGRPRWIASDRSAAAIRSASATFEHSGIEVAVVSADGARLPFRARSLDVVLAFMVFQHLDRPDGVLGEIDRVLGDGGRLAVVVPGRWSVASATSLVRRTLGWWPYDPRNFAARDLRALLAPRFDVRALRTFHLGFDRPVSALADRTLGAFLPSWGRYLAALCRKR